MRRLTRSLAATSSLLLGFPSVVLAQMTETARDTGVSAIWVLANISYAGMRAQAHPSLAWRFFSFIGGFPGTLISFLVVREGGGRAYGVVLPRPERSRTEEPAQLRFEVRDS